MTITDTQLDIGFLSGGLDSRITFTRASTATYFDASGTMRTASSNAPRFDFDPSTFLPKGLLIEEARTNSIRNSTMLGAVAGTPGTLPTNWSYIINSGLSTQIVGSGIQNGINYIDVRFFGTCGNPWFSTNFDTLSPVSAGDWTVSAYIAVLSGDVSVFYSGGITFVVPIGGGQGSVQSSAFVPSATMRRFSYTYTATGSPTSMQPSMFFALSGAGASTDVTFRIGAPQLEAGSFPTSYIPTSGAAVTRAADAATMAYFVSLVTGSLSVDYLVGGAAGALDRFAAQLDAGSSANRDFLFEGSGTLNSNAGQVIIGGAATVLTGGTLSANVANSIASAWGGTTLSACMAGGTVQTTTTVGGSGGSTSLRLGMNNTSTSQLNGHVRRIRHWARALTNAELQLATTQASNTFGSIAARPRKPAARLTGKMNLTGTLAVVPRKPFAAIAASASIPITGTPGTTGTNNASLIFYAAEISAYLPGSGALTIQYGHGTRAHGTFAQNSDGPVSASVVQRASDVGYRTSAAVDGDPLVYPPLLADEFQIDRRFNLPPSQPGIAAAWGTLALANDGNQFSSLVAAWNNAGRALSILYGTKLLEDFPDVRNQRTTTGSYIDALGAFHTAAAGAARVDYATGTRVLLNEPAATNTLYSSAAIGGTGWTLGAVTLVLSVSAPDGTSTANYIRDTAVTAQHLVSQTPQAGSPPGTVAIGSIWTFSVFAKAFTSTVCALTSNGEGQATFDLSAGTVAFGGSVSAASIRPMVGGWFRCIATFVKTTTNATVYISPTNSVGSYLGTSKGVYLWGAQFESGATATSYIPTASATTATRTADNNYTARQIFTDPAYTSLVPVFRGLQSPWALSETALQIPLRDASYWLERPLQTTQYQGSGTYQGVASLTGTLLPKARGGTAGNPIRNVTPILIDPVALIYQYSDAAGTVVNLYEGGALTITRQTDTANLYVGSTTAGQFRTDNSRGLFQLGSSPAAAITCDVTGAFAVAGAQTTAVMIARYLLTEELALPAANIDTANFSTVDTAYSYTAGAYFDPSASNSGLDAVSFMLAGLGGKLYPGRDGKLRVMALRAPSGSPVVIFNQSNTVSVATRALDAAIDPPPYRIRVGYNHNYTVQTSGLLGSITSAQRTFVGTADTFAATSSATVLSNYLRPNDLPAIITTLLGSASAPTVATALLALWGVRRRLYTITVPVSLGLARDLGDVVQLTWPMDDLAAGKIGVIVGETFNSLESTIAFTVLV